MKYAIFGDMHGSELKDLDKALQSEDPDVLVCTGDYDQVRTIHQFMDIERRYLESGKKVVKVPGNHDQAILDNLFITFGMLYEQGKDASVLHYELNESPEARRFIHDLVYRDGLNKPNIRKTIYLDKERFGKDFKTVVTHGAIDYNPRTHSITPSEYINDLWIRLKLVEDFEINFRSMSSEGIKIMIRGHDHEPTLAIEDSSGQISGKVANLDSEYVLSKRNRYIINPGALFHGNFAIINTREPRKKLPRLRYFQL